MVAESAPWTLEELVRRATLALHRAARDGGYSGAPNKRVREVPDQRAIRWYISTGLLDRPQGGRGRGARYGERHLHQLVAIKRLQAAGLALAEIQARLVGADDAMLRAASGVSPEVVAPSESGLPDHVSPDLDGADLDGADRDGADRARFWAAARGGKPSPDRSRPGPSVPALFRPGALGEVTGVVLPGGVTVVLRAAAVRVQDLDDAARQDLARAAEPLLRELVRLGLINPDPTDPDPTDPDPTDPDPTDPDPTGLAPAPLRGEQP